MLQAPIETGEVRLEEAVFRVDRELKIQMVAHLLQAAAVVSLQEGAEILGPENDRVHRRGGGGNPGHAPVEGVGHLELAPGDALHEPRHEKGRDVGAAGRRDDHVNAC